jgi:hypothetical protein
MKRFFLVACVGLGVCWGAGEVWGQARPSEFFMEEFTFGLLGGFLGGPTVELVYVTTFCREAPNPELCQGLGFAAMQVVIYTITLPARSERRDHRGGDSGVASLTTPLDCILTNYCIFTYLFAMVGSWRRMAQCCGSSSRSQSF